MCGNRGGLTTRHVVVLDEAAMVGSRPLDELRSYVDAAGAKLVLLGDNRQLSSIDAGGALRSLSSELGSHVVTLTINRRQAGSDQQWERDALVALRHGDVTPAVEAYVEHGRVTITTTIDEARQAHRGGLVERPSRADDRHPGRPAIRRRRAERDGQGPPPSSR